MSRYSHKDELKELQRLRKKAPNAIRLSETLFDLAKLHRSEALETLAIQVDGAHCQTGHEISDSDTKRVIELAARTFGEEAG